MLKSVKKIWTKAWSKLSFSIYYRQREIIRNIPLFRYVNTAPALTWCDFPCASSLLNVAFMPPTLLCSTTRCNTSSDRGRLMWDAICWIYFAGSFGIEMVRQVDKKKSSRMITIWPNGLPLTPHPKITPVNVTRKRFHRDRTQFRVKKRPGIWSGSWRLDTHNEVILSPLWAIFRGSWPISGSSLTRKWVWHQWDPFWFDPAVFLECRLTSSLTLPIWPIPIQFLP